MATADLHLRALKCKVLGRITALDFKLKEVQGSITSLEIAMEELGNKLQTLFILNSNAIIDSDTSVFRFTASGACRGDVQYGSDCG
jgi:hypothetical protein